MPNPNDDLLKNCVKIAKRAGTEVMEIYNSGNFDIETKSEDGFVSPLTRADKVSNNIIEAGLKEISDLPIISEEGNHDTSATSFWLVDPIDGTKGFVNKNDEFTVNIGLIEHGRPVLGVVLAPAKGLLYYGGKDLGAFKVTGDNKATEIKAEFKASKLVVFVSRNHREPEVDEFLEKLGDYEELNMDSSLKFCLVADGTAAFYPRFAPCMLWDTAAAEAVLIAAGGKIVRAADGQPLAYDPGELLNPSFIAAASNQQLLASRLVAAHF